MGGGAFGTAMAQVLGRNGHKVVMWVREYEVAESINKNHTNDLFLRGVKISPNITASNDPIEALAGTEIVLIVIPTPYLRSVMIKHRDSLPLQVPLVCCTKGIEQGTLLTPYEILVAELPGKYHDMLCAVSGPSFAKEVAKGLPTNVLCASVSENVAIWVQNVMSDKAFRVYTGVDVIGAELCGAIKNVIAIACGASKGYGFERNTAAALITRGLVEMTRLCLAKGAKPETMTGLAGIGDLLLTCTSNKSRNFTVGKRIAGGETLQEIIDNMKMVAEGVKTSVSVHKLSKQLGIEMPICEQVYQVLHQGKSFKKALDELQARPLGKEFHCFENYVKNTDSKL